MKKIISFSLWLIGMLLAISPVYAGEQKAVYHCEDGEEFSVVFHNDASGKGYISLIFLDMGGKMTLSQALSADGERYAAGRVEFWIKGLQASFTQGDSKTTCKSG